MIPKHVKNDELAKTLDTFNLSEKQLESAYTGDTEVLKRLGRMAEQGRLASEIAPKISQHVGEIIAGTVAVEKSQAQILSEAGKGDLEIKKAIASISMSGSKYVNQMKEQAAKFSADLSLEQNRHTHTFSHLSLLAAIASNTQKAEQEYQNKNTAQQVFQKQREADYNHQQQQSMEFLERGSMARDLPKKDFLSGLRSFGKSLGF